MNHGEKLENLHELYCDICKLAVLSNLEIDRAKKEFTINTFTELKILKDKYKITEDGKTVRPKFFKMICVENGYTPSENIKYAEFDTSMDYLQKVLTRFNFREARAAKRETIPFMDIVKKPDVEYLSQGYYKTKAIEIINLVRESKAEVKRLFVDYDTKSPEDKLEIQKRASETKQDCTDDVEAMTKSPGVMYWVLKELEKKETGDVYRYCFEVMFGKPNEQFFTMIKESSEDIEVLKRDEYGEIEFYGIRFSKVPVKVSAYKREENMQIV